MPLSHPSTTAIDFEANISLISKRNWWLNHDIVADLRSPRVAIYVSCAVPAKTETVENARVINGFISCCRCYTSIRTSGEALASKLAAVAGGSLVG